MNIKGDKVILRAIEPSDGPLLKGLINDPETEYLLGGWSYPVSTQVQNDWISGLKNDIHTLRCIIELVEEKVAIGTVMLSDIDFKNGNAQVHIKISGDGLRGKGYGHDAINTIVKYALMELRLTCVYANVSSHNVASLNLFTKCGFIREGILRKRLFKRGSFIDVVVLSIIKD